MPGKHPPERGMLMRRHVQMVDPLTLQPLQLFERDLQPGGSIQRWLRLAVVSQPQVHIENLRIKEINVNRQEPLRLRRRFGRLGDFFTRDGHATGLRDLKRFRSGLPASEPIAEGSAPKRPQTVACKELIDDSLGR
jgi:hypothetical protein